MKAKAAFYFLILFRQLLSLERYRRKKVSKLRSIVELRALYGICIWYLKKCILRWRVNMHVSTVLHRLRWYLLRNPSRMKIKNLSIFSCCSIINCDLRCFLSLGALRECARVSLHLLHVPRGQIRGRNGKKVSKSFFLAIHSHLYDIFSLHRLEYISWNYICLLEIWIIWFQKESAIPWFKIPHMNLKKEILVPFRKILVPEPELPRTVILAGHFYS